jgi:hypothetical protein
MASPKTIEGIYRRKQIRLNFSQPFITKRDPLAAGIGKARPGGFPAIAN